MFSELFHHIATAESEQNPAFGIDMSIEGMSTQGFSTGMFYFLIFAIVVFLVISFMFMFKGPAQKLKKGEKILFIWILLGVVVAIIFGAAQMMHGFLV
ncbi:MAG: hypothetical protein PVF34_02380 [Gammaproteobacteria bacterium]|jgi:hypothetical protein